MPIRAENNKIMETKKQLLNEREPEACLYGPPTLRKLKPERDTDPEMKSQQESESQPETDQQPLLQRHGCLTAWLWIIVIFNAFSGIRTIIEGIQEEYIDSTIQTIVMISGIMSLAVATGAILLLNWKKIGFWIIICMTVIDLILTIFIISSYDVPASSFISPLIGAVIGPIILFAALQAKQDGVSCWSQLK